MSVNIVLILFCLGVLFVKKGLLGAAFSEVDGLMIEVNHFKFCVGSHHDERASEKTEHNIGHQKVALNVGFMERLTSLDRDDLVQYRI